MTCARLGGSAAWFFSRRRDGEEGAGGVALQDQACLRDLAPAPGVVGEGIVQGKISRASWPFSADLRRRLDLGQRRTSTMKIATLMAIALVNTLVTGCAPSGSTDADLPGCSRVVDVDGLCPASLPRSTAWECLQKPTSAAFECVTQAADNGIFCCREE